MKLSVVLNPVPGNQELFAAGKPPGLDQEAASIGSDVRAQESAVVVLASQSRPLTVIALSGVAMPSSGEREEGAVHELPLLADFEITATLLEESLLAPIRYTAPFSSNKLPRRIPVRSLPPFILLQVTPLSLDRKILVVPLVAAPDPDPKSACAAR